MPRPDEIAQQFYAIMPRSLSPDTFVDYGLEVSSEQSQHIAREMLSLNLYWIHSALLANLSAQDAEHVFRELQNCIEITWESDLQLQKSDVQSYWREMKERRQAYDQIIRSGGTPMALYLEAADLLESTQVIRTEVRQKLLAVFIDLVPVDAFGELAADVS